MSKYPARVDTNSVRVSGVLPKDPELKISPKGIAYLNFSLAVGSRLKDGSAATTWVACTAFQKTAEFLGDRLRKGAHVEVDGPISVKTHDGKTRWTVIANVVRPFAQWPKVSEDAATPPAPEPSETPSCDPQVEGGGDFW